VSRRRGANPYKGPDHFTKDARRRGYPARSVAKLEEIDRRVRLLRPGQRVLDLGAAPGSWSLYASERIGPTGRLLAIDRSPIEVALPAYATFRQADALALPTSGLDAPYDVVLSDMAPSTTGTPSADQAQSFELLARALEIAEEVLVRGGAFVGKIFMGPDFEEARRRLAAAFTTQRTIRPSATRGSSFEVFVVGLGRR
jgi:23S rRNA (uridine2552-2'-O)-methyltransferase